MLTESIKNVFKSTKHSMSSKAENGITKHENNAVRA